jgi:ribosomal protein S18 acetylase RimI-like enzyme
MTTEPKILRLGMDDLEWMTELLTEAFLAEAPATHLFLGPKRRFQTSYFMRCSCAYALLFGECYATTDKQGVALWLLPGKTAMSLGKMHKAGMLAAPFRMGLSAFSRFMGFAAHTDKLHKAAAPMPHYYLFAVGVLPSAQGKGVGGLLVRSMLERTDREKLPTYLETQSCRNVELYKRLGFNVAAEEPFPKIEGLNNWGMLRAAVVA